jgi:predicted nucleic acid-binding protein
VVLVDTSVWVHHFRDGDSELERLLNDGQVMCHPFIVGELACGNLENRKEVLSLLQLLPMATLAGHKEVLQFIERNHMMEKGLGYIDVHLSVSALLTAVPMWTYDKRLMAANRRLGTSYEPSSVS